ncbi:hypothetical protein [Mycolicibacterium wolinskyi]|nr:hypothetical protein [Mycolicibacterium wolinskyi]
MAEQLMMDFDPQATAARTTADNEIAAAYATLVATAAVCEADARAQGLHMTSRQNDGRVTVLICPACGQYEANEFLIANNHGLHRSGLHKRHDGTWVTRGREFGRQWCLALDLTSRHAAAGAHLSPRQTRMVDRLRADVRARFEREVAELRQRLAERHD